MPLCVPLTLLAGKALSSLLAPDVRRHSENRGEASPWQERSMRWAGALVVVFVLSAQGLAYRGGSYSWEGYSRWYVVAVTLVVALLCMPILLGLVVAVRRTVKFGLFGRRVALGLLLVSALLLDAFHYASWVSHRTYRDYVVSTALGKWVGNAEVFGKMAPALSMENVMRPRYVWHGNHSYLGMLDGAEQARFLLVERYGEDRYGETNPVEGRLLGMFPRAILLTEYYIGDGSFVGLFATDGS
jgi:hypothetical protein